MARWTTKDIPPQSGRTAIVTGTGGLGYEDALALARAGASVIIAGRNPVKGNAAVAGIVNAVPTASIRFEKLDLASLLSVADFGDRMRSQLASVDILINNAGVMVPPTRTETLDKLELQLGTNHLGHFALTGALLPLLRKGRDPRVVSVSSVAARDGAINFHDLNEKQSYSPIKAYSQSKLACLMFAFELQRRSDAAGWGITSVAAHPGVTRTDLFHNAPGRRSVAAIARSVLWFLFQPAAQGALPTLYAATSPDAAPGGYYGPDRLRETRGYPVPARIPLLATDEAAAARLWQVSEDMTGMRFGALFATT